ncbi:MAG: ribonuclease H-like YkuK family protein [Thermodesulfobacteriota bacterium]
MEDPERHPLDGFVSPSRGKVGDGGVFAEITSFVTEAPGLTHNVIIGTDSFLADETVFVAAIIIHRVGHGGRYFYKKHRRRKMTSMRQRIFYEATMSIELAGAVRAGLDRSGLSALPVEIHLDVGDKGETKEIIKQVVGMVMGSGYAAVTKPASYGASKVADRHSR